jgi:hypothetical protein
VLPAGAGSDGRSAVLRSGGAGSRRQVSPAATIRVRDYITVTAAYWAFTLTDGARRPKPCATVLENALAGQMDVTVVAPGDRRGQADSEPRAVTDPGARGSDRPPMSLDHVAHDRQPQSQAAVPAGH